MERERANLAWRIEEACFYAWPALKETVCNGWLLRFSKGVSRRSNSANPLRSGRTDSDALVAACEVAYRAEGLPPIFRTPSLIGPDMQNRLARLGYAAEGESLVLHADIAEAVGSAADPGVVLMPRPTADWLSAMSQARRDSEQHRETYRSIVESIAVPAIFAMLHSEGQIVALGYGSVHDRLLCLESVVTDAAFRGRGFARRMLTSLIARARPEVSGVCLQVQADNSAATALYGSLGLRELYRYHYQRSR